MDNTKDAEVLRDEMLEKISDKYQKTEGFPVWEIISGAAYGLKYLWDKIFKVEKLLNVNNLSGRRNYSGGFVIQYYWRCNVPFCC